MTVNIPTQPNVQPQQPSPPPPQPTPLNPAVSQPTETESKKNTVFALILNSVLTTSMVTPNLVEKYFAEANQELISSSFSKVAVASIIELTERVYYLREYLNVYSIKRDEFPVFLRITICKAEFKSLSIEEQNKMKSLQIAALLNLNKLGLTDNRVSELTLLSQNVANIFYHFFNQN
uniref:Uncharacterized protein n=1 Tax=Panagrolaimus sp. PS1159 TaxID=55785 RepID=A0AC35F0J2_9BILA